MPNSDITGLIAAAIADPGKILPRVEGESVARWGARAVEASLEVAEKEFVDGQVAQANILGWNMGAGVTDIQVSIAMETAAGLVGAAKTFLAVTGAENYVEQHVHDRETGERYTLTIQRPGKKTPHELRLAAEDEVARLRAQMAKPCGSCHPCDNNAVMTAARAYYHSGGDVDDHNELMDAVRVEADRG